MFDRILLDLDAFLAAIVFKTSQPVGSSVEFVEITYLNLTNEFFITGKSTVGRQQQEVGSNTLDISIFIDLAHECRERLP